jgi:hypothetical protein
MLIEYSQKDKMKITGSSFEFYGDRSSMGRKNVCSMNDSDYSNFSSNDSGNSTPCSILDHTNPNLSEVENLNREIELLRLIIQRRNRNLCAWVGVRPLADKIDRDLPLTWREQERWNLAMHSLHHGTWFWPRISHILRNHGNSGVVESQIHKCMGSIRRASIRIDMHNQRIQTILAETSQNHSQNQSNGADNSSSDSDNN